MCMLKFHKTSQPYGATDMHSLAACPPLLTYNTIRLQDKQCRRVDKDPQRRQHLVEKNQLPTSCCVTSLLRQSYTEQRLV